METRQFLKPSGWLVSWLRGLCIAAILMPLSGCIGTVVGAAVDTTIEVIKVPIKVGGAIIDVVTPDDLSDGAQLQVNQPDDQEAAIDSESEGL